MKEPNVDFPWIIEDTRHWPPRGRFSAPFGPTILEILRSCPLRGCFEASKGYERRIGYAARVGMAFHRALQSLADTPPWGQSTAEIAETAQQRFLTELEKQEAEKRQRPRERGLPKDELRVKRALEAITVEALRMARENLLTGSNIEFSGSPIQAALPEEEDLTPTPTEQAIPIEVEIPVSSLDNLLQGRIDRAEHLPEGTRLLDYKSALRDDLPERYERQIQLYALLWKENRGEWPIEAVVVYPLTGSAYQVSVDPETCERIGAEYRALISQIEHSSSANELAAPGDVCKVCEFRPWCNPFWQWQASETSHMMALKRAAIGFEGQITSIASKDFHWKLEVRWRNCTIRIVAPLERFPQLKQAHIGMRIRALEMRLQGQLYQPQAIVTELSELFLM